MEKKNVKSVSDEELKAATGGGFPLRGCRTEKSQKTCERHSDCRWDEGKQSCGFK